MRQLRAITIPPDDCFMMGGTRGVSDDSRFRCPVRADCVAGRACVCSWPDGGVRGF